VVDNSDLILKAKLQVQETLKGLGNLGEGIRKLTGINTQSQKTGAQDAVKHSYAQETLRKQMLATSEAVKSVLSPAMAGFGIKMLGISGTIAAATKSVKDFGETAQTLKFVSRETSLTTSTLQQMETAYVRAGSSAEAANAHLIKNAQDWKNYHQYAQSTLGDYFWDSRSEVV
jgi:hypothetical protein